MRTVAIGLAATLACAVLLQGFASAEAGRAGGGGGLVAIETLTIQHEGFDGKRPQSQMRYGKYVISKVPGRPQAKGGTAKFRSIGGLKMEQDVVEGKKRRPAKATGGTTKSNGGPVVRYHLEQAWPAK